MFSRPPPGIRPGLDSIGHFILPCWAPSQPALLPSLLRALLQSVNHGHQTLVPGSASREPHLDIHLPHSWPLWTNYKWGGCSSALLMVLELRKVHDSHNDNRYYYYYWWPGVSALLWVPLTLSVRVPPKFQTVLWHLSKNLCPSHAECREPEARNSSFSILLCWASQAAQTVKNPPAKRDTWVQTLDWKDPLEGEMSTHEKSEILLCWVLSVWVHRWFRGKEFTCQCTSCRRPRFNPWVRKIPWRRKWQPTPVLLPGESHGQRSLVGYSPWWSQRVRYDWATECFLHGQCCSDSVRQRHEWDIGSALLHSCVDKTASQATSWEGTWGSAGARWVCEGAGVQRGDCLELGGGSVPAGFPGEGL